MNKYVTSCHFHSILKNRMMIWTDRLTTLQNPLKIWMDQIMISQNRIMILKDRLTIWKDCTMRTLIPVVMNFCGWLTLSSPCVQEMSFEMKSSPICSDFCIEELNSLQQAYSCLNFCLRAGSLLTSCWRIGSCLNFCWPADSSPTCDYQADCNFQTEPLFVIDK